MVNALDPGGNFPRAHKPAIVKGRYSAEKYKYQSLSGAELGPTIKNATAFAVTDRQVIETSSHPVSLLGRVGYDIGGSFRSSRATVSGGSGISITRIIPGNPNAITGVSGHFYASSDAAAVCSQSVSSKEAEQAYLQSSLPPATDLVMLQKGATAISRVAPTNPLVDLSTSLAELLREGLPSLPGRQGNPGSEYLNYQFGIAPLASDIRDLRAVNKQADALWARYARNSGKGMRRRYEFPPEVVTTTTVATSRVPQSVRLESGSFDGLTGLHIQSGTLFQRTTTTTRYWFSGSFTYYLPDSPFRAFLAKLDFLYGMQPGVDTLYQLTPWSWLLDYFTNVGDVVENLNAFVTDGLVMPYAYIMAEKTIETQSRLDYKVWSGGQFQPATLEDTVVRVSKRRVPAHPFGFGVLQTGLTGKQQAILIALGLTKL